MNDRPFELDAGHSEKVSVAAASSVIEQLCTPDRHVNPQTLEAVLMLAVEIAREGREGRKIGTLFVIGDTDRVMHASRPLMLDPLFGHPPERKRITDPTVRETIKELALLDGGFVVSNDGVMLSAARYIDVVTEDLELPLGLGTRHLAAASITRQTNSVAVVVSESSVVRLFDDGKLVSEILPELWMLRYYAGSAPTTAPPPAEPEPDSVALIDREAEAT